MRKIGAGQVGAGTAVFSAEEKFVRCKNVSEFFVFVLDAFWLSKSHDVATSDSFIEEILPEPASQRNSKWRANLNFDPSVVIRKIQTGRCGLFRNKLAEIAKARGLSSVKERISREIREEGS